MNKNGSSSTAPDSNEDYENIIAKLNRECHCASVDIKKLHSQVDAILNQHGISSALLETHPHLFAAAPVFLSLHHVQRMQEIINAIQYVTNLSVFQQYVLSCSPMIASKEVKSLGGLLGYDFHVGTRGPQLIEINTNAGGALLNIILAKAQELCCDQINKFYNPINMGAIELQLIEIFRQEWQLQRGNQQLNTIAIIDDKPSQQYLYPEFILFKQLFKLHDLEAIIVDIADLSIKDGRLCYGKYQIDLVYNRLTDFYFSKPESKILYEAYNDDLAAFTPHPRAFGIYANKLNLTVLSDEDLLRTWQVPENYIHILKTGIPTTYKIKDFSPEQLWQQRNRYFFKPIAGYGSKGSYRGDKLTHKIFNTILHEDYVIQEIIPPSERHIHLELPLVLKMDIRNYVYNNQILLLAARLYQGQTTNFRTRGGGFAPIFYPKVF